MLIELAILIAGLTVLLVGGETLVRAASNLALSLGMSPLAIGLTVVAFGTSAPELFVNVRASLAQTGALSFGNIFGSNMANIGLIIGMTALLSPLPIQNIVTRRELPMLLLATVAFGVLGFDARFGGGDDQLSRGDGFILLLFFIVFLYYTVGDLARQRNEGLAEESLSPLLAGAPKPPDQPPGLAKSIALTTLGLVGLSVGASFTVDSAVALATLFGVPEVIVGLTLVSIGTSLPELTAAIMAVRKNAIDMAVGSIVGSNIFNTLLIAGVTAVIKPMEIPPSALLDVGATVVLTLTLMLASSTHRQIIIRYEGGALLAMYVGYMAYRTL